METVKIKRKDEQLKSNQERFQSLVENMRYWAWELDNQNIYTYVNYGVKYVLGYEPEEILQKSVFDLTPKENLKRKRKALASVFASFEPFTGLTNVMKHKDGHRVILDSSGFPFFDKHGRLLGYRGVDRDFTEESNLREDMKSYLERLTKAQEQERQRIARDLHDDTAQLLTRVCNDCDLILSNKKILSTNMINQLSQIRDINRCVLSDIRRVCLELRPSLLDRFGLVPAIELLITEVNKEKLIKCRLKEYATLGRLSPDVELGLFRITQEALSNCRRHSNATEVIISIYLTDKSLRLAVVDNGIGFKLPSSLNKFTRLGKLGLIGMRERVNLLNGTWKIDSNLGNGTTVTIDIPKTHLY